MEENVKIDISTRPKQPILNLAKTLDTYMKTRIKIENPNPTQYDTMYDFIQRTKSGILGIGYLPLSKYDRRVASKLCDILNMEIIINKKIMADDYELDNTITRKQVDLDSMKGELFTIIFTNIYLSRYVEKKVLGTLTPREIIDFFDVFEEGIVHTLEKGETRERNNELAAGIGGDEDETDIAATFYEKVIKHHEINNPIGAILEDIFYRRSMSYKHIFTKTLEHADIIREYFKNYPEIFVISFCAFLNPDMMHQACEEIFPEKYRNPDMKNYINYHYGIENNNEE